MKRVIRRKIFESNSSSTHSCTILSKEKFKDWKDGKILHQKHTDNIFIKREEELEAWKKSYKKYQEEYKDSKWYKDMTLEEYIENQKEEGEAFQTYEEWEEWGEGLQTDVTEYTTPKGEEIIIACKYGNDY